MKKLKTHDVQAGMLLAKTLFNDQGDLLLRSGVVLTSSTIAMLARRGFNIIYVRDQDSLDDDDFDDFVSESVRQRVFQQIRSIHVHTMQLARHVIHLPINQRLQELAGLSGFRAFENARFFDPLVAGVNDLVDETMNERVFINLNNTHSDDTYTYFHDVDMAIVAVMLGRRIGLPRPTLRQLALGCMLHDIGAQLLPPHLMEKEGELEHAEWEEVRQHPLLGYELLQRTGLNGIDLLPKHVALQHHERQDGGGYPRGLVGTNEVRLGGSTPPGQILPIAEIAAVVDVYDALRADRPHRPAFPPEEIVSILRRAAGHHLNRAMVEILLSVMPLYPTDSPVVVVSPGPYHGYRGVVVTTLPESLTRPVIRLLEDADGGAIAPVRLDLSRDRTVEIASPAVASQVDGGGPVPR